MRIQWNDDPTAYLTTVMAAQKRTSMTAYENRSGNSGVTSFRITQKSIIVEFRNGAGYLYTYTSAGPHNIEQMKILARTGLGLNTFISQYVGDSFAKRLW